ncbi:hypothetical protein LCGC14_2428370, partial [marine sediment metagenome]
MVAKLARPYAITFEILHVQR